MATVNSVSSFRPGPYVIRISHPEKGSVQETLIVEQNSAPVAAKTLETLPQD